MRVIRIPINEYRPLKKSIASLVLAKRSWIALKFNSLSHYVLPIWIFLRCEELIRAEEKNGVIHMPRKEVREYLTGDGGKYVRYPIVKSKSQK